MNIGEIGNMMKLAQEAKKSQKEQEDIWKKQTELLENISITLDKILATLKKTNGK
ncbi:MAG: hypothetical protein P9M06_00185 [Candidatus Saelkia tenebricola]|nr:hypothetical protein [Candidatus Saelkia tenebricola]